MEREGGHSHRGFSGRSSAPGIPDCGSREGLRLRRERRGWNRVTIKDKPEDTYYESRQRIMELTLYMNATVKQYYGRYPRAR